MTHVSIMARSKGDPKVVRTGTGSLSASDKLARGLGWFSIALGVAELAMARRLTRKLGLRGKEDLVRAYGIREISSGLLCLSVNKQTGLWSRLAGDALDIATLTRGLHRANPKRPNVGLALALVAGVTALDMMAAQKATARRRRRYGQARDYRDRSGFPGGVRGARGRARAGFETPREMVAGPIAG